MSDKIPIEIKNYTILRPIGSGTMGSVYLAKQNCLDRLVAIKVIKCPLGDENCKIRAFREAKILAKFKHPHIVSIYDSGELKNQKEYYYMILEFIEKGSLATRIHYMKNINEYEIWTFIRDVCHGLQAALQHNIIHRDVKPANIMLTARCAKIGDFGIAKELESDENITVKGTLLGTPNYMAPELTKTAKNTFKSDIYSLGISAYQSLTKKLPFGNDKMMVTLLKHVHDKVDAPSIHNPSLFVYSNFIVAKMIQKDPEKRYESYGDLIVDIENVTNDHPPEFASIDDCEKVYHDSSLKLLHTKSKQRFTKSILMVMSRKKHSLLDYYDNVVITSVWNMEKRIANAVKGAHFIKNSMEIEHFLQKNQQKNNLVIIDVDYQKERSVVFFDFLCQRFPETHVIFTSDKQHILCKSSGICFAGSNLKNFSKLRTAFKVRDIPLSTVVKLVGSNLKKTDLQIENDCDKDTTFPVTGVLQNEVEPVSQSLFSVLLCSCAASGNLQHLRELVNSGAKINIGDYDKRTALHLASAEGQFHIVEYLIEQGADVNAKDRWGATPLKDAIRYSHDKVAKLLKDNGAIAE